jgi:hypothetical protein
LWNALRSPALGLAAASICLAILVATDRWLVIVWDEGYTLGREERLRSWFRALADPESFARTWSPTTEDLVPPNRFAAPPPDLLRTRAGLLSPPALDWFWPFAREEPDGHPPVYALVGLLGDLFTPAWDPLPRARLGPIFVFSLTAGAIFVFLLARHGLPAAVAAYAAWIWQPHLFALAHYATYDGLLTSFWVGATLAFAKAVEPANGHSRRAIPRWPWVVFFSTLSACAMGTKLTGWFVPIPLAFWAIAYRQRAGLIALAVGFVLALAILNVLIPPWWHDPIVGIGRFFESNLSRDRTTPLPTLFLGTIYQTPDGSLPWYNTIVWTLMVTPVGFLLLALNGVHRAVTKPKSHALDGLFLASWVFPLLLRSLPHTPGHDGVRQFLPAFGFLAIMAGLGAGGGKERNRRWRCGILIIAVFEGILSVVVMMPVPLSYYSPLVAGLPGAARLGMEPTFYWDALQPDILDWLNNHTTAYERVLFARYPTSWLYLRQTKRLRAGILPTEPGEWKWYVLQNRPGAFRPWEREMIAHGNPVRIYDKLGVPLLWVFPYGELQKFQILDGIPSAP